MPERLFLRLKFANLSYNPFIKVLFAVETFFWSAWNTAVPIISIFIVKEIPGATIQVVTFGISIHVLSRVVGDFLSTFIAKGEEHRRIDIIIIGTLIVNLSYLGFIFFKEISAIYILYVVAGLGIGVAAPIRGALISLHLDRKKETRDWATLDIFILLGISICTALSGIIVSRFGFNFFFFLAAVINTLSIVPLLLYSLRHKDA